MIIFLDVDGTLINYKGELPDSARAAINQARLNGHSVYVCTGCSKREIDIRNWELELDGMIGGNGCYIESHKKVIFHETLSLEQCRKFVEWCENRWLAFRLECNSGIYISEDYEEKSNLARLMYIEGNDADISKNKKAPMNPAMIKGGVLIRDDVNKTAFVLSSYQDYLDAKNEFSNLIVGTWGGKDERPLYGDVSPKSTSKANAIEILLKYLNTDFANTIAFGDAVSDISMFEVCKIGVAMGNAGDKTKEASDYITDDVDSDGLFNAFKHFGII